MTQKYNILISRTDSIGDVILSLPMAGILKNKFPNATISFLGKNYTRDIINACTHIDEFLSVDELSQSSFEEQVNFIAQKKFTHCIHVFPVYEIARLIRKARIPIRVGTTNRIFHWVTCNKLVRLSRKKSELHEAQLNCKLLSVFGINDEFSIKELSNYFGFTKVEQLDSNYHALLDTNRKNIIIHPKSQGSAHEWPIQHYIRLINKIDKNKFKIFVSGTENERKFIQEILDQCPDANDIIGKMNLKQFISFINQIDGLIACSTGPLHIAAVCSKTAIGLFTSIRPMHPGRWAPIGEKTSIVIMNNAVDVEINLIIQELDKI